MVSAIHLAAKLIDQLPQKHTNPATTDGYDGFIHCYQMSGNVAEATLHIILRDFTREGLVQKGELVQALCSHLQNSEPRAQIKCDITKQYRNMAYWLENDMRPVNLAVAAAKEAGLSPYHKPTRGAPMALALLKWACQPQISLPACKTFMGHWNMSVCRIWRRQRRHVLIWCRSGCKVVSTCLGSSRP